MAYKYFAFISYRHTDVREAKRLQALLEGYSLPAALQKMKPDAPRRFHVFRDTDELTSGVLTDELHKKLDQSKWLVVICSPSSAKSKYVGQEIAYFRKQGRAREIIPFIISGTPHSRDNECFHRQLTLGGLELLGIDVQAEPSPTRRKRFHRAFIRLVAKMLDLSFDELWRRRERYLRRRLAMQIGIIAVIVAAVAYGLSSRPFGMDVQLQAAMPSLPLSADGTDSLYLYLADDDVRAMPIAGLDKAVSFPNIPGKYRHDQTRMVLRAYGFKRTDTLVSLDKTVTLPLRRDVETFGRLRFTLTDSDTDAPLAGAVVDLGFMKATTGADGLLDVLVPLEHQKTEYPVTITQGGRQLRLVYGNGTLHPTQSGDPLYVSPK